jgi:hypothetical protein
LFPFKPGTGSSDRKSPSRGLFDPEGENDSAWARSLQGESPHPTISKILDNVPGKAQERRASLGLRGIRTSSKERVVWLKVRKRGQRPIA